MSRPARPLRAASGTLLALLLASAAGAESELRLVAPSGFGPIAAATYDAEGQRVGPARLGVEQLEDGLVRIYSEYGFEGGARAQSSAVLAPTGPGAGFRILREESRSHRPDGTPLGVLAIDHERAVASCTPPGEAAVELALPAHDRVANVPMHLLFVPLVRGDEERVHFQMFLCGGRPRLLDFEAFVARRREPGGEGRDMVEVRWEPDLGLVPRLVARGFVPRLSLWFGPEGGVPWLAHRLPLYNTGPEVTVVREGVPPHLLDGI